MAAPIGNKFWKARSKHGRAKIFESDVMLLEVCEEYFDWVEKNPLFESRIAQDNGSPVEIPLPKMRAMTIGGLCTFIGITIETWSQYRKSKDFSEVITRVEQIIRDQKFSGAAAGLLNPNIIARDLGLTDKQETKHDVTDRLSDLLCEIDGNSKGLPNVDSQ